LDSPAISEKIRDQIRAGRYEMAEARRLPALIEPGDRVMELGAGIGFLTALAGLQGKAQAIVALEANPDLISVVEALHRLNRVESTVCNAVAVPRRTSATLPFHLHHDLWASSLSPLKARHLRAVVDVPALSLAELLRGHAPTLLIIDIEVLGGWVTDLEGLRLNGVMKVLVELKPGRFTPLEIKRIFDAFSREDFHYDPLHSEGGLILFRRIQHQDVS